MTKIITRVISTFDTSGNATLVIPNHAESVALKFYENPPDDISQQIALILLIDVPPIVGGTHTRMFTIVPDGNPVPAEFIKYIATFPYGPNKILVHCIEIGKNETGDFNADKAVITGPQPFAAPRAKTKRGK